MTVRWGPSLTTARIHLDIRLITAYAAWLPDRWPDSGTCEAWRERHAIGPTHEAEALHRAWHLREPLWEICTPGNHEPTHLT
ncbi:hypothetical protein [Streptomyces sp. NPDC093149]|uniref:hypothetical protein n=1 Tax=Streptomyces sp. NPDC093149 TaxID=3366031 RepID=UPI003820E584